MRGEVLTATLMEKLSLLLLLSLDSLFKKESFEKLGSHHISSRGQEQPVSLQDGGSWGPRTQQASREEREERERLQDKVPACAVLHQRRGIPREDALLAFQEALGARDRDELG